MGVTIFYKGQLQSPELLTPLTEELASLAEEMGWKHFRFADEKPFITGVSLQLHPQAEPLGFFFDTAGRLVNIAAAGVFLRDHAGEQDRFDESCYLCWCKTQFAGPFTHKMAIELPDYLEKKYFAILEITDEGDYYPGRNEQELMQRMDFLNKMMDAVTHLLETGRAPENLPEPQRKQLQEGYEQLNLMLKLFANNAHLKNKN